MSAVASESASAISMANSSLMVRILRDSSSRRSSSVRCPAATTSLIVVVSSRAALATSDRNVSVSTNSRGR